MTNKKIVNNARKVKTKAENTKELFYKNISYTMNGFEIQKLKTNTKHKFLY